MAKQDKPQKKDVVDLSLNLTSHAFEFIRVNFKELFTKTYKAHAISGIVSIIILLLFGLVAVGIVLAAASLDSGNALLTTTSSNSGNTLVTTATLIVAGLVALIGTGVVLSSWIGTAISSTAMVIVKEQFNGKYPGIRKTFDDIKIPVLKYMLLKWGMVIAGIGLPAAIIFAPMWYFGGNIGIFAAMVLGVIYLALFILILSFLTQFWLLEIIFNKKRTVEALKESYNLTKKNLLGVFLYDVIIVVAGVMIGIPFGVVDFGMRVVLQIGIIGSGIIQNTDLILGTMIIGIGIYLIIKVILAFAEAALHSTIIFPYKYLFWKEIADNETRKN